MYINHDKLKDSYSELKNCISDMQELHEKRIKIMKRMLFSAVIRAASFGYAIGFTVGYQTNPHHKDAPVIESKSQKNVLTD